MNENEPDFNKKLTKKELLSMMKEEIKALQRLPPHAMTTPVMVMDHLALITHIVCIFEAED